MIQADYERLQALRPAKQDQNAVGWHYGPKILEVIASKGEVRNVTCNLTWTGATANTPLQADITLAVVTAFAMDMYMSNAMLQPSASDGKVEDAAAGSQDTVESAEPAPACSEAVTIHAIRGVCQGCIWIFEVCKARPGLISERGLLCAGGIAFPGWLVGNWPGSWSGAAK